MTGVAERPESATRLTLAQLVLIFFHIGALAFGGGGSTLSMMHSEFCRRRRVLTEEEFQLLFSLSRLVPGMNLLALTVLLGHRTHGLSGSLLALVAMTVPSFTLILLGCQLLQGSPSSPYLSGAVRGLSVGVAALLTELAVQTCRDALLGRAAASRTLWLAMLAGALILAQFPSLHPAWTIVGGGLLGLLLFPYVRERPS